MSNTLTTEYLTPPSAMKYLDIKDIKTFKRFCDKHGIPIIARRVSKSLIDKKLSGKK